MRAHDIVAIRTIYTAFSYDPVLDRDSNLPPSSRQKANVLHVTPVPQLLVNGMDVLIFNPSPPHFYTVIQIRMFGYNNCEQNIFFCIFPIPMSMAKYKLYIWILTILLFLIVFKLEQITYKYNIFESKVLL